MYKSRQNCFLLDFLAHKLKYFQSNMIGQTQLRITTLYLKITLNYLIIDYRVDLFIKFSQIYLNNLKL